MKFKNREEKIERKKKEKRERRKGKGRKKGKKEEKSKKVLNFLPCYDIFSSLSQKFFAPSARISKYQPFASRKHKSGGIW